MKKTNFTFLIIIFISLLILSCASRKDIIYLQDINSGSNALGLNNSDSVYFEAPIFKPDDRLTINISSINPEAAQPFNLSAVAYNTGGVSSSGQIQQQSYLISHNGMIKFPQLGEIKVIGKTRLELENFIEDKLKNLLPDAKANVQLVNFRISVLGQVSKPGEYLIDRDKISILQAIGLAGDLTIHGKRDEIMVVRESNGILAYYKLDIRKKSIINSPAFYLKQNDVIIVAPNKPQVNASASSPTASYIISATGLLITIISILSR